MSGVSAVFEVATLADAVTKANRIAPTKGTEFDRAAGIVIDVDSSRKERVIVKSTDLEITIRLDVNVLSVDGAAVWRVPSRLLYGLMSSLPISGAEVKLLDIGDGSLYFQSGKTKAKLRQVLGDYPEFDKDHTPLTTAPNLAARLAQVAWATDQRGSGALSGVHIDGEYLYACNRANAAIVPCAVRLEKPVTAPLTEISSIIKNTGEVMIGATEHKLVIMPDDHTQATCTLIGYDYPKILPLLDRAPKAYSFEMSAEPVISMIERTLVLMKEERLPATNIEIGDGYMKMSMSTDSGLIIDEHAVTGGTPPGRDPLKIAFKPDVLRNAINASGRPVLTVAYGPKITDPWLLSDDNEFRALMMPIVKPT